MLRQTMKIFIPSLRDVIGRLDSMEKEVIELKAFRQAVEATSPEVAVAAGALAKERRKALADINAVVDNPLTSDEFVELNHFYALQIERKLPLSNMAHIHSLEDLCSHAKLIHREYLVRVAQRSRALAHAPIGLSQMQSIQELRRLYEWSFHDVKSTSAPDDVESALKFDSLIRRVFLRHHKMNSLLREGMYELAQRERWTEDFLSDKSLEVQIEGLEKFFDVLCTGRVKLQFLLGNYLYLSTRVLQVEPKDSEKLTIPLFFDHDPDTFAGQICRKCSLTTLLKHSIRSVERLYDESAIELRVAGDSDLTFVGIPCILYDVLLAMIYDAVEANLLRQENFGMPCTPIVVTLSQRKENEMFCVRVSDTAGGMPLPEAQHALSYWYSFKRTTNMVRHADMSTENPIRMHYAHCAARALGGDISVVSIEGYGTDRTLYTPSSGVGEISI